MRFSSESFIFSPPFAAAKAGGDFLPFNWVIRKSGFWQPNFEKLQKIAQTLNVEIYEFFRFEHKKPKDALIKEMNELFINAPDEKIEIIYKIVTTLLV